MKANRSRSRLPFGCLLLALAQGAFAQDMGGAAQREITLSDMEAIAVASALRQFQREQADPGNYSAVIRPNGSDFLVVFVPKPGPRDTGIRGGRTEFGREVHYIVAPNGDVTRTTYAR